MRVLRRAEYRVGESGKSRLFVEMMHVSLKRLWWLAEILWKRHYNWAKKKWERRLNLGQRRTIPPKSLTHESAYQRGCNCARRLPPDAIPTS
jgi:hypothetical protein